MLHQNPSALKDIALADDCVVVVGSGAVGLYLAVQIAQLGRQVIVLESGDRAMANFSPETFEVVGRAHDGIRLGRSVGLGGTTNLWGGQLVEFNPVDFNGRDWLAGSKWPISHADIAPYFPLTFEALGIPPQAQNDAAVWNGLNQTPPNLKHGTRVVLTRWMKTPNVSMHFDKQVDENPNLHVVLNATVVAVEGDQQKVTSLAVQDSSGQIHSVAGGQFVLAAGTVENVRLLLHTAESSPWNCPWRTNDNVGRYFQDHLGGRIASLKPRSAKEFFRIFSTIVLKGDKFQPKITLTPEVLQSEPLVNHLANVAFESSIKENLVFLKQFFKAALFSRKIGSLWELFRNMLACSRHMIPLMWKYLVENRILIPSGSKISLTVQSEVRPLRKSRITIDPAVRDKFGLSKVLLDWQVRDDEVEQIRDFAERVKAALDEAGLADMEIDPLLAAGDPKFLDALHDTNHHSGGCVMGSSQDDGVVDANLKVFGTENLYAAGACVYRTASSSNATFTAMTLATRLAEHLTGGKRDTPQAEGNRAAN